MMERIPDFLFGICILLLTSIGSSNSQQTCPTPDFPAGGNYSPRKETFKPGDDIKYSCEESHLLRGEMSSRCKLNGEWLNPTPFCDRSATLINSFAVVTAGRRSPSYITDRNTTTCFNLKSGEKLVVNMAEERVVYAVRLFLGSGNAKFDISTANNACTESHDGLLETSQWVLIESKNCLKHTSSVMIQDKASKTSNYSICEIEVYVKEENGCEKPPSRKISEGHFKVGRSRAILICDDGYKSVNNVLLCEQSEWKDNNPKCEEILCNPQLPFINSTGKEWMFIDVVNKISAGTRREIKCGTGYQKIGGPDIIVCRKNGTWTESNAACVEIKKPKFDTRTIIFAVVGVVVSLIIIILLGTTIYIVRKQRNQVVVVYKPPTEGSVVSGSEGDYALPYYETTVDSSQPTVQILDDRYFSPFDNKKNLTKQPMPADIAFGTIKQSSLYGC